MTMLQGPALAKSAVVPSPSARPYWLGPPPAKVVTAAVATIISRTAPFPLSVTKSRSPSVVTAMPVILAKVAALPMPLELPEIGVLTALPPPASLVTTSDGMLIFRTKQVHVSPTYSVSDDVASARDAGPPKVAAAPFPSAQPDAPLPAMVVTAPVEVRIERTLLLLMSPT